MLQSRGTGLVVEADDVVVFALPFSSGAQPCEEPVEIFLEREADMARAEKKALLQGKTAIQVIGHDGIDDRTAQVPVQDEEALEGLGIIRPNPVDVVLDLLPRTVGRCRQRPIEYAPPDSDDRTAPVLAAILQELLDGHEERHVGRVGEIQQTRRNAVVAHEGEPGEDVLLRRRVLESRQDKAALEVAEELEFQLPAAAHAHFEAAASPSFQSEIEGGFQDFALGAEQNTTVDPLGPASRRITLLFGALQKLAEPLHDVAVMRRDPAAWHFLC
ncbi:MAG: hypothetical protein A4E73_00547 [Syntrophaceae bacterium PtaU1.Bin231]|nr:MAG: hypothetical protein A4E73_00547 [Syntrophaceae bacterium PtaU1.Bin231]